MAQRPSSRFFRVQVRRGGGVLPGFSLSAGFAIAYLGLIVLVPLGALLLRAAEMSWAEFFAAVTGPRALAAYKLSFGASFIAAVLNLLFGPIVAWVLVRYSFPGKGVLDAMVDLPFALPTAVAGIALTAVFSAHGWLGSLLATYGVRVVYTPVGVIVALTFVGLPFVVRTVQPVILGLDPQVEEAAAVLGASRLRTFVSVVFPNLLPALLTGFALAFARAVGEYGSVIFIAGNLPFRTEIVPLLIVIKLEQYDYAGATALAVVMLAASFVFLLTLNGLQAWSRKRTGK
ncbi:MAG: sulfate ABC transporter permease subunit CysT [Myxococcota bacterium]